MRLLRAALAALILLLCVSAPAETVLTAVNVGKGDAILLQYGETALLFDLGRAETGGRIAAALKNAGVEALDAVIVTHADSDHVGGLDYILQSGIVVREWITSPFCIKYKTAKHPLRRAGLDPLTPQAGEVLTFGELTLKVLAPLQAAEDEDDDSLVIMVESPDGRILMTGDMEAPEERGLLASDADLSCAILKVPNHGDDDAAVCGLPEAAQAEAAVISTDPWEKPGTPDPLLLEELSDNGTEIFLTEGTGAVELTLTDGRVVGRLLPEEEAPGGITAELDAKEGTVTLYNGTGAPLSLGGWYLVSEKKEELFLLPEAELPAGASLTIGTAKSDPELCDLIWPEKGVFSKKKPDSVTLYTPGGAPAACAENGM